MSNVKQDLSANLKKNNKNTAANSISNNIWQTKSIKETAYYLKTNIESGLDQEEAGRRIKKTGYNELEGREGRSPFRIFISQFNDFMIWILIAAAFISGIIIKEVADAIFILIILIINSILGFIQEYRAEKALQALKELASPTAIVIRNGREKNINSKNLVPGDVIKLSAGDLVPADCRIISGVNLQVDESVITGESLPASKSAAILKKR
jgi:Ca2+-transporting ATPase